MKPRRLAFPFGVVTALIVAACTSQSGLRREYVSALADQRDGRPEHAQKRYETILMADPSFEGAANNLAILTLQSGDADAAVRRLRQELKGHPKLRAARINEVLALLRTQKKTGARVKATALAADFPTDPVARAVHGRVLVALHQDPVAARQSLSFALKEGTPQVKAQAAFARGVLAARAADWAGAEAAFAATGQLRRDAVAHFNRGVALGHLRRYPEALRETVLAAALDAKAVEIPHLRAILALAAGQPKVAEAALEVLLAAAPKRVGVALIGGVLAMLHRDWTAAEAAFRQELSRNPTDQRAEHNLGIALARQDRLDAASVAFERAARLDPDTAVGKASQHNHAALQRILGR